MGTDYSGGEGGQGGGAQCPHKKKKKPFPYGAISHQNQSLSQIFFE